MPKKLMNLYHFGKNITQLREKAGLNQLQLAKKAFIDRTFLNKIEKGEGNPSFTTVMKIVDALGVDLGEIFSSTSIEGRDESGRLRQVTFLKLGGTWDMQKGADGFVGKGFLDDEDFAALEKQVNFQEGKILDALQKRVSAQQSTRDAATYFPWAPKLKRLIKGKFVSLFSGDSSHYRPALIAVMLEYIFREAKTHPNIPILIGLGTDTTDILLPLLDVFFFDQDVHPILMTGANRSHTEKDSDAPENFHDLAYATHLSLAKGAYYVFQHSIFRGGDLAKIDPREDPQAVEGMLTFFAPLRTQMKLGVVDYENFSPLILKYLGKNLQVWSAREIFTNLEKILTIDLGQMNSIEMEVERILDPKYPAVIIQSHGLGNVSQPIRRATLKAVKNGKLVINVSRCLVPETAKRYAASLSHEKGVIDGKKISARVAKGIVLRVLLEKMDAQQAQTLLDRYLESLCG
jgi:L-asparaginase/Glu-tRNA(Gln) amidotransferase subunit D/DNA-binding XRE family transcriptional regulator